MNSKRLLGAEITVFAAYIAFVVAGMAFAKMVEYDDFSDVTHGNTLITVAFNTLVAGAYIALLAVVIGGLPLAFAAARYAITDAPLAHPGAAGRAAAGLRRAALAISRSSDRCWRRPSTPAMA